jgi:hypothetical protein
MTFSPYEEAQERIRQRTVEPVKALKKGAALAGTFAGGSSILNRLLPLLNQHIPEEISKKGISKISPHLGQFVESATNFGYDFYGVRDFLRAKAAEEKDRESEKKQKPPESKNIIQQYSPELFSFLSQSIKQGRSPMEAAGLASMQGQFKKVIKKLTEDHQAPFSSIISSVFGGANQAQQKAPGMNREGLTQQFNQGQQGTGQVQQGQGKAALLQSMQEITNALRQMRGNG